MKPIRVHVFLLLLFALLFTIAPFGCGGDDDDDDNDDTGDDDDDDDNDDTGDDDDDDDDTGDDDDDIDEPPVISGTTEFENTQDITGPYTIETEVTDNVGLDSVSLFYQVDDGGYSEVAMDKAKAGYTADIPGQAEGSLIEYYVSATDTASLITTDPATAPTDVYSFNILQEHDIAYDDGTDELEFNVEGPDCFVMLRVTPPSYPATLTTISYFVKTLQGAGEVEPFVIYDEDGGDPPDITTAFSVGSSFTPSVLEEYVEIDVSGVTELATPLMAGDFYIGFKNTTYISVQWAWDTDFTESRSWMCFVEDSSGDWYNFLDDKNIQGTWLMRATILAP